MERENESDRYRHSAGGHYGAFSGFCFCSEGVRSREGCPGAGRRIRRRFSRNTDADCEAGHSSDHGGCRPEEDLFLEEVRKQLGLKECRILHARAEDLGKMQLHREKYDVVVSRAVAPMRVLSEYCLPFVRVGGYFIAHKGPAAPEEIRSAGQAIRILGGRIDNMEKVDITGSEKTHILVVIEKVAKTPSKYPRSAGKPKKSPL